jgi:hypothetical protein
MHASLLAAAEDCTEVSATVCSGCCQPPADVCQLHAAAGCKSMQLALNSLSAYNYKGVSGTRKATCKAGRGGVGVQLLCCFWSGCWAPPGIRALGVSAGGGGAVGLRQSGSLGCCVWPASRFCPPCNQQKKAGRAYASCQCLPRRAKQGCAACTAGSSHCNAQLLICRSSLSSLYAVSAVIMTHAV